MESSFIGDISDKQKTCLYIKNSWILCIHYRLEILLQVTQKAKHFNVFEAGLEPEGQELVHKHL